MDSLTQLTFGAACAEKILGKEVGRKAMAWGAIIGTLPDLDVFLPMGSPVNDFVYHRGFSHSIFVLALLSPILAWLITVIHPTTKKYYLKWLVLTFVILQGSVLLDLMTIYGTQILWPFDKTPLALPVFFIIDPFFTLPILIGCIAALVVKRTNLIGHRINSIGLVMSSAYLIWAIVAFQIVDHRVKEKLQSQGIAYSQVVSSPGPFNTLLWRVIGIQDDQYFESYYSLLDGDAPLYVDFYPRNLELSAGIEEHPPVTKLEHFTRGYFAFSQIDDDIAMTDLRMGSEPNYVFSFKVAEVQDSTIVPTEDVQLETPRDFSRLGWIWDRIWTPLPQK